MILDTTALSDFLKEEPGIRRNVAASTSFNIPENDLWVAALVRQYDLPLLSTDSHFDSV